MNLRERYEGYVEYKNGFGPKGLSKRALKQNIMARKELPVIRVEEKIIHGQRVSVRILPTGKAEGCEWWQQECCSKWHHGTLLDKRCK